MVTVLTSLIFSGAFVAASYAILATLLPAMPQVLAVLRGAELAARVPVTEPRRNRVRMQVLPASPRPEWRAAA